MSELEDVTTTAALPQVSTVAQYAKAQVALLPLISRTVKYKQTSLTEVEGVAEKHQVPVSDLISWFQAATSL